MKRPGGVVAIAVLDFAGSGLLLGLTGLVLLGAVAQLTAAVQRPEAAELAGRLTAISMVYLLPAAWGILTGIGLLRMRLWALASTLVFAYLLVCAGVGMGIASVWAPIPARTPAAESIARLFIGTLALGVGGLGVWWLAYCCRPSLRPQLAAGGGWARRPLSVSILGLVGIVAGFGCVLLALSPHATLTVFGWVASGATARGAYLAVGLVQVVVGAGLLWLRPWARMAGLALYALAMLNSAAIWLFPRGMERTLQAMATSNPMLTNAAAQKLMFAFLLMGTISGVVTGLLSLYFLWTRRSAFYPEPAVASEAPAPGEPAAAEAHGENAE